MLEIVSMILFFQVTCGRESDEHSKVDINVYQLNIKNVQRLTRI